MEKELPKDIPYVAFERTMTRLTNIIRWLVIVIVIISVMFIGYIVYDKYQDSQYDYADVDINSEDGGNASFMHGNGVISNVEGESSQKDIEE